LASSSSTREAQRAATQTRGNELGHETCPMPTTVS
jgi:hypothetical protein